MTGPAPWRPRTSTAGRSRRQLALASLLSAAAVGIASAIVDLMTAGPPWWSVVLAMALIISVGQLAVLSRQIRQRSAAVLAGAASALAVVIAASGGVLGWLLVAGRLPLTVEQPLVDAALVGLLAAASLAAVLVPGVRRAARSALTRGGRAPTELLAALAGRSEVVSDETELLRELAESLRRSMRLRAAEIWTGNGASLERTVLLGNSVAPPESHSDGNAAAAGASRQPNRLTGDALRRLRRTGVSGRGWLELWLPELLIGREDRRLRLVPAVHGDAVLALVLVERAADDDPFAPADERLLGELAGRLAIVRRNRALNSALQHTLDELQIANEELRASRARLVASSDAQRRRVERDLHDGAQQHLVALAVSLNLLRGSMTEITAEQAELVDELDSGVRSTITELRNLAHGIYPPLLRDAGLASALAAAARRSPSPVAVRSSLVNRYPQEIEAAIYFCCLEGLQNAAKHAPGARVVVKIDEEPVADLEPSATIVFSISDDGPGFDPAAGRAGAGLINMTDRIGAIGGRISWVSEPGHGSTVAGSVPMQQVLARQPQGAGILPGPPGAGALTGPPGAGT
ncbi:MAG: histidine kinase [Nakamurella sp.]